jgi:hypothetical protein
MNKKTILPTITLICVLIINITTVLSGIKHHENYLITMGAIGCTMILIVAVLQIVKFNKDKKKRQIL